MSKRCKALAGATVAAFFAASLASRAAETQPAPSARPAIAVAGSTTLTELAKAAAERYARQYSDADVTVTASGSRAALLALAAGTLDVALTDFAPDGAAFSDHRIAVLTFAVVVHPASGVTSLTRAQLRDVLSGKVANWSQVGGADVPVTIVGRGPHSGVWQLVQRKLAGGAALASGALLAEATRTALDAVARTPGAVTVAAVLPARAAKVTLLSLDGAPPDDAHVIDGSYPLWSYEHAVTSGAPSTAVSRYLGVIESDRGTLHALGFIAVRELGPGALVP
ncbi:MAG: phosphate ABC transporter substrate-binding protein [Vulcanimicrobiaceae bacterium]